jgi:hypothetical protein
MTLVGTGRKGNYTINRITQRSPQTVRRQGREKAKGFAQPLDPRMITIVREGQIRRRVNTILVRNGATEDRLVENRFLPWNWLATLVMFGPELEQLFRRNQTEDTKSIVIKSQADNMEDDTEEWVVVEIECVSFSAKRVRGPVDNLEDVEYLTVSCASDETWSSPT